MAKSYPYPEGNGAVRWVSTQWLNEHLKDVTIIDTQPNIHDYIAEHIPGASYVNEEFLRSAVDGTPAIFMDPSVVEPYFQAAGVSNDRPVVVYTAKGANKGRGDGLEQTMLAYGLTRAGHGSILILNGGLEQWKADGFPVTQEFPKTRKGDFKGRLAQHFITYEDFKREKDGEDVVLLDARPAATYEGKGPWPKAGHIPGARSLPWASLMSPDNPRLLKPDDEILKLVEAVGATKDKSIICSCGTGREATNEFNLFKWYLQYPDVRIYEGSFTEWSSYPDNPTVTGKEPGGPQKRTVAQRA